MTRRKQVSESRRLIEEGLVRVVRTGGYTVAGVSDIALEAGVSRTTFYRHYATKRDVLLSLFARISREVLDEAVLPGEPNLRVLVRRRFAFIADHPELPALLADPNVQACFTSSVASSVARSAHRAPNNRPPSRGSSTSEAPTR